MKTLRNLAIVILLMYAVVLLVHYGPPRFWGDFTGMREAEVIERLGHPFLDSRRAPDGNPEEYRLGWYQGFDQGFFIEFKNGVAVSQKRDSR